MRLSWRVRLTDSSGETIFRFGRRIAPPEGATPWGRVMDPLKQRRSRLEALSAMYSNLQANLAHDLRTPLAAIRGYIRLILEGRAGPVSPQQREYLGVIVENTDKLIHLANWMTRAGDAFGDEMEVAFVDLAELWRDCVSRQSIDVMRKSIRIEQSFSEDSFEVPGDRNRLRRAFDDALRVAVHYSSTNGRLTVRFSRLRDGGISVKFSGIAGAVPDAAPGPEQEGGLADAYDIISLHGGRLLVRRTPEEGSSVAITLPPVRSAGKHARAGRRSA